MSVVLAFDTATASTVVGLASGATILSRRDDPAQGARPNHAERLLGLCEEVLAEAGAGWRDVSRIGVGVGPGTFTGLRIGVATARALAQASGAELAPISTLGALARGAVEHDGWSDHSCLAVLDARRGEVFTASWAPNLNLLVEPVPIAPQRISEVVHRSYEPWLAVGDGAVRYREHLASASVTVPPDDSPLHRVDGAVLAHLAVEGGPVRPGALVPDYLRLPDAEIARRKESAAG